MGEHSVCNEGARVQILLPRDYKYGSEEESASNNLSGYRPSKK
ncbi:hypothetical protein ACJDU8_06245 [Clostridium sp. WILCCON 0269]|uniref:Peptidylprolyl isomerase n=1 Tax=Candidatus Clostridium eludens TaxID=3381663 RepID=A0ABW8SIJ4_9CLOT